MRVTLNYLGEAVESYEQARSAAQIYLELLNRIEKSELDASISIKPTQMGLALGQEELTEIVRPVVLRAEKYGNFVRFDMEHSEHVDPTLNVVEDLWREGHRKLGVVLQANRRRSEVDARRSAELGIRVRLCKGAYEEPRELAHTEQRAVDASFANLTRILLEGGHYPAIATHDEEIKQQAIREYAARQEIRRGAFEFQMFYGVRRDLQEQLQFTGFPLRVYVPFGDAWYEYLMGRVAERPANLVFLAVSMAKESPLGALLRRRRAYPEPS